jgi:hypothetical protein
MRIGIGLPAAVPGSDASQLGDWAARTESGGFSSLGVIDRLVYDNVEPLVALAAAAARTQRVELRPERIAALLLETARGATVRPAPADLAPAGFAVSDASPVLTGNGIRQKTGHTRPRRRRSATCASLGRSLNYTGATNDVIFPR